MNRCHSYQEMIEEYLADEISSQDRTDLEEHCIACRECAGLMELHQSLLDVGAEIPVPEKAEFRDMREAVVAVTEKHDKARNSPEAESGFLVDLGKLWRSHPLPAGFATAAVLVCAIDLYKITVKETRSGLKFRAKLDKRHAKSTGLHVTLFVPRHFDIKSSSGGGVISITDVTGEFRGKTAGGGSLWSMFLEKLI